jgi:hypothetical protein
MTYHRIFNRSNTTGDTSGADTEYPSIAPEFTQFFSPEEKNRRYNNQKKRTDDTITRRKEQTIQSPEEKG